MHKHISLHPSMSSMSWARFNLGFLGNSLVLIHRRYIRAHTPQHRSMRLHHRRAWSHVADPWVLRQHRAVGEQLLCKVIWLSVPLRHYLIKHSKRTWIRFPKLLYARLSCHHKVSERVSGRECANECVSRVTSCARVIWDDRSFHSCRIHTHTHSSLLAQNYLSHKSHICIHVRMYRYMQSSAEACSDQRPFSAIRTNSHISAITMEILIFLN